MISLEKTGNAIKFTFDNNGHYLQDGTIEVPVNSLTLVTDDSDMFTFKKSATNDIFVSGLYSEIGMSKSELETFYKNNMVGSTGGGSGSGITSGEVQTMIDESISGLAESSAVTLEIAEATSGKADSDSLATVATSGSYDDLTNKPTIPTVPTSNTAFTNDAGYITEDALNGYATEQWVGEQGYLTEHQSLSAYSTTEQMNSAISSATDDMATQTWVGEQGYITGVDLSNYATLQDIPDVSNYFDGAEYDSGTTRINFYHGNTVKAYIDASAFVIDGMIDDVRIETIGGTSYLVIDFNTASGKEDIQIPLTDIFDPSNYYNKTEVDNAISAATSGKADTSAVTEAISTATNDMATQTWVNNQGFLTEHQSLSAYSTTEEVNSAIQEATSGKADTSAVTAVNDVLTTHTADTTIHVTSADKTSWNAKSDFSGSYNDLTDKPTIPTVPTSNTAFTNDAGYITEDALSGYAESSAVTEEITAAVSGKVDITTFTGYSGSVETALSGKQDTLSAGTNITISGNVISAEGGGSITIDPTLDSGSTNAVANSAITEAVTAPEYPIEGTLSAKHFWDDENMGCYTEIGDSTSIKVPNSTLLSNPYIAYAFASDSEFMGGGVGYVATVTNGAITDLQMLNGSSISSLTATYDGSYTYFTPSGGTFSGDNIGVIAVMGMDYEPMDFMDLGWTARENGANVGIISVIGNIPSERIKQSVNRIYDTFNGFNDFNPIADTVTLDDGQSDIGRNDDGIGYGVLNYNTYNPLSDTVTSGNTSDVFKYSSIDFNGDGNVFKFNKTVILKESFASIGVTTQITDFTNESTTQFNDSKIFGPTNCLIFQTNAASTDNHYQMTINISGPNDKSGYISFRSDMGANRGLNVQIQYNDYQIDKVFSPFILGNSYLIDLRDIGFGDEDGTHTFTVENWDNNTFLSWIKFFNVASGNKVMSLTDAVAPLSNGEIPTNYEMYAELSHKVGNTSINLYDYGSPSAITVSGYATIRDFYGISISGVTSGNSFYINVKTDDVAGTFVDGLSIGSDGNITSSNFSKEPIPYYLNTELTKFDNGVWDVYFIDGTKASYISFSDYSGDVTVYSSLTVTSIKEAISGKLDASAITTSVTSGSTDAQVPSAKAVNDKLGGLSLEKLTQAEFDAMVSGGTVDASTLYLIGDSNGYTMKLGTVNVN